MPQIRVEFLTGICIRCRGFTSQAEVGNTRICARHEPDKYAEIKRRCDAFNRKKNAGGRKDE